MEGGLFEQKIRDVHDEMSPEEVGFATGIFRSPMLEEFTFPTYALNKKKHKFPKHLTGNYQFKNLFLEAWKDWEIYVRPSYTGLFVIRLTRIYQKATPLMDVTQDVIRLQESLDVQSARQRLEKIRIEYADKPAERAEKETSVLKFLEWLGADEKSPEKLLYAPVQWKLAMEVCKLFVEAIGYSIPVQDAPIKLIQPEPELSNPLHDSYVLYHHAEIWANRLFVLGDKDDAAPQKLAPDDMRPVHPQNIRTSMDLQQQLASLIEGALLKKPKGNSREAEEVTDGRSKYTPRFEPGLAKRVIELDAATWEDEFCLLTPRAALVVPSRHSRNHELLIATLPSSTSRFNYIRYWGAMERMIEFVVEIHVLARLLERRSFSILEQLAEIMDEIRGHLFSGDIRIHEKLPELVKDATHLRRLTALCQALGDPHFWSRAEYATGKADLLMRQLGLPQMLNQIERNISSINSVVDHVDEWYMADLTEQSNDMATLLSVGLAAASFILTILILPSFWADLKDVSLPENGKLAINIVGTVLASILILSGSALTILSLKYGSQIIKIMRRSLLRLQKTFERNGI